jgi:hypothetical protein
MGKITDGFYSLFDPTPNRQQSDGDSVLEGVAGEYVDELELSMSDDELIRQAKKWESIYNSYREDINLVKRSKKNKEYWTGKQNDDDIRNDLKDNLIFEALETLIPIMTRQNPEPLIRIYDEEDVAKSLRDMIDFQVDQLSLRIKIKQVVRHWNLSFIGCIKIGWDMVEDDMTIMSINPKRLVLDPKGYIDAGRFKGRYIGEIREATAEEVVARFPKKKEAITELVNEKMGTELNYTEWWTPEYVFYTCKDIVLGKSKNPHWNYKNEEQELQDDGTYRDVIRKKNHFTTPQMPYCFLGVFSLQEQPHDETTLAEQALGLQDALNKRHRQIDKNVDAMNNTLVFGGGVSKEDATQAKASLDMGHAIHLETNDVRAAFMRDSPPPLPNQVFQTIQDYRSEIRSIMGTSGSTPQGIVNEDTLGGKLAIRGQDVDRVSLVVDHIEEMVDYLFNWMVQIFYVYYTEPRVAMMVGEDNATEFAKLDNKMLFDKKVLVSVQEGSLIPKDTLTRANQAIDLYGAGAMDLQSLYEFLEFPNPKETAQKAFLHANSPQELYAPQAGAQQQVAEEGTMPSSQLNPLEVAQPPEITPNI